jgi:hypothetical protein
VLFAPAFGRILRVGIMRALHRTAFALFERFRVVVFERKALAQHLGEQFDLGAVPQVAPQALQPVQQAEAVGPGLAELVLQRVGAALR